MALSSAEKREVLSKYGRSENDTGSPEAQIALLTKRLEVLNNHFASNKLDRHSRRGLLQVVSRRRRLLNYLKNEDIQRYRSLIADLGLRK